MHPTRSRPGRHAARLLLVWALLLALAMQGCTGVLVQLLGPLHRHAPASAAAAGVGGQGQGWLDAFQAWQRDLQARSGATGLLAHRSAAHGHHHLFERHHHATGDATVVALDGGAAGDEAAAENAAAAAGSVTSPGGPAFGLKLPAAAARATWGLPAPTRPWQDAAARRPERPPPA